MLSLLGWLNGILVTFTISFTIIFGSWFMYKSIKLKAKLLFYESLMIIIGWLFLLGICIDFFVIILTGENIAASNEFIRILSSDPNSCIMHPYKTRVFGLEEIKP